MAAKKKATARSEMPARKEEDERAKRLASFSDSNPNPVLEVDVSCRITYANPAAHQILERLGLDPADLDVFLPVDMAPILKDWDQKSRFSLDREIHLQGMVFGETIALVPEFRVARIHGFDITKRKQAEEYILQLNQELAQRAHDLETANEELQVTNEELRVANEDLALEVDRRKQAEELAHARAEALRVNEERFRFVLSNSPVVVATLDRELRYTWIHNPVPGFERKDILGRTVGLATDPAAQEHMLKLLQDVVSHGSSAQWEITVQAPDGDKIFESHAEPLRDAQDEITGVAMLSMDITQRKRTEGALREAEQNANDLIRYAPTAIYEIDFRGPRFTRVNDAMCQMSGYTREELLAMSPYALLDDDSQKRFAERVRGTFAGEPIDEWVEYKAIRKDGGEVYTVLQTRFLYEDGKPIGAFVIAHDVSEQKQFELRLKDIANKYAALFDTTSDGVWIHNLKGEILEVNDAYCRMSGYSRDELTHMPISTLEAAESLEEIAQHIQRVLEAGGHDRFESRHRRKDGSVFDVDITALYLEREGGQIAVFTRDITERKRAEAALRESEERFRTMADGSPEILWVTNAEGSLQFVNRAHREFFGVSFEEVEGSKWEPLVHPADAADYIASFRRSVEAHAPFTAEARVRRADGEWRWIASYAEPRFSPEGEFMGHVGLSPDITERKRAEEELRRRTEELQAIMEAVPTAVFITRDPDARTITGNRAARELVELPPSANISKSAPEEERPTGWQEMRDGIAIAPDDLPLQQAVRGQEVRDYEMDLIFQDGTVKSVLGSATPLRDEGGQPQGGVAVLIDMTQRKLADEHIRHLNEALEQRAGELEVANEELERLATSLALDLRSPLVSLRGVSRVLAQDYGAQLPPQAQELFHLIQANAEEMEVLTQGLLQLMHVTRQSLRKQELKPAEIVRAALAELQPQRTGHPAEIHVGPLPACCADPLLLKQVWVNLLSNALKATRRKERAHIEIGARAEEDRTVYFVKDNGVGFDMSYAGTIFHAFQSYHRPEDWGGSKVGLAIVDSIIRRHGGRVWAEGAIDQGAAFYFEV